MLMIFQNTEKKKDNLKLPSLLSFPIILSSTTLLFVFIEDFFSKIESVFQVYS